MKVITFDSIEERAAGWTHMFKLFAVTDVNAAGTAQTITVLSGLPQGNLIRNAALYIKTAFSGGAASAVTCSFGVDHATTTDVPTALINAAELLAAGRLAVVDSTGTAFATLRNGVGVIDSGGASLTAVFTATGANLSTLTAGEVWLFAEIYALHLLK